MDHLPTADEQHVLAVEEVKRVAVAHPALVMIDFAPTCLRIIYAFLERSRNWAERFVEAKQRRDANTTEALDVLLQLPKHPDTPPQLSRALMDANSFLNRAIKRMRERADVPAADQLKAMSAARSCIYLLCATFFRHTQAPETRRASSRAIKAPSSPAKASPRQVGVSPSVPGAPRVLLPPPAHQETRDKAVRYMDELQDLHPELELTNFRTVYGTFVRALTDMDTDWAENLWTVAKENQRTNALNFLARNPDRILTDDVQRAVLTIFTFLEALYRNLTERHVMDKRARMIVTIARDCADLFAFTFLATVAPCGESDPDEDVSEADATETKRRRAAVRKAVVRHDGNVVVVRFGKASSG
ncbi:MAG: hypothetical protein WCV84_03825 [Patescibacteria group bacterium]